MQLKEWSENQQSNFNFVRIRLYSRKEMQISVPNFMAIHPIIVSTCH